MGTLTEANLGSGIRVAATPIRRRKRRPSSRATPKPQYADAVLYSFQHQTFLEVSVRTTAVEDTVRRLKRAARYQERQTGNEVRVQISVEAYTPEQIEADPKLKNKSLVKFLGHAPWELGRRVAKARAEAEPEPATEVKPAEPGRHRRTVAKRRGQHAALCNAMVRAVITRAATLVHPPGEGSLFFLVRSDCIQA